MDFKRLADKAKNVFQKRDGSAAVEEDVPAETAADPGAAPSPGGPAGRPPTGPGMAGPTPSTTPTEPTAPETPPPSDAPPPTEQP